jgi:hypothetical protein
MGLIDQLVAQLDEVGLRLLKAQPRGSGRLSMELATQDGSVCAGQWNHDSAEVARVASLVGDRFGAESFDVVAQGRLLVQHAGADRRLPVLSRLLRRPDAVLVAHRPERRAVVRLGTDRYVKVVRPGRTGDVVAPLRLVRPEGARVPEVVSVDDRRGLVTMATLPGRTLLELVSDPSTDDGRLAADVAEVGATVRRLHGHTSLLSRGTHDGAAEVAAARRWLAAASDHGLLDPAAWEPLLHRAAATLPGPVARSALLHRDLHDKQVVLAPGERTGLLDLDLATHGDPAVDVANLVAHLDLRVRQGSCARDRAARCTAALLEGYAPDGALLGRLSPYIALTRLRLAGVYSFRPTPPGLVEELLDAAAGVGAPAPATGY